MSLSLLQASAQTYGLIWRHGALVLRFALVPWILLALAWVFYDFLLETRPQLGWWLADLVSLLGKLLVLPLAVQCCRLTALGTGVVRRDGFYRLGPEFGKVAALVVVWFLVNYLIETALFEAHIERFFLLAAGLMTGEPGEFLVSTAYFLVSAVLLLAALRVILRLLLVFPGLCLGRPWELRDHWQETRGKIWSLLGLLMATTLPVVLLVAALQWNSGALEGPVAWPPTVLGVLATLLLAALECFYEAAFAVATTIAFVSLGGLQPGAADSPSASPQPA